MTCPEIINRLKNALTAGYFYDDNKIINWGGNFYCKDYDEKSNTTRTYNITDKEAKVKIKKSLLD